MHPELPTILESGVAQLELESWFGLFAPARTPPEVLDKLRADLAKVIAMPDVVDTFRKAGGKPLNLGIADTRALVQREVQRWTRLIRDADIRAD